MSELFTDIELGDYLRKPVSVDAALSVERVVWGWLRPVLKVSVRPDPVPEEVFSWAIELAAIAYENPSGLDSKSTGPFGEQFSAERRAEILNEAASGGAPSGPLGCFPPARGWPDPARTC